MSMIILVLTFLYFQCVVLPSLSFKKDRTESGKATSQKETSMFRLMGFSFGLLWDFDLPLMIQKLNSEQALYLYFERELIVFMCRMGLTECMICILQSVYYNTRLTDIANRIFGLSLLPELNSWRMSSMTMVLYNFYFTLTLLKLRRALFLVRTVRKEKPNMPGRKDIRTWLQQRTLQIEGASRSDFPGHGIKLIIQELLL